MRDDFSNREDGAPARFLWLPPGLRPPVQMPYRVERFFLQVGVAALFAGFDMNVYGLAIPQIQASLNIPENQVGLTVSYFRLATVVAMLLAAFPHELVAAIAGLALLGTIAGALAAALKDEAHRDAAILTFLVGLSGLKFFGIGSAFWAVVAGGIALVVTQWRRPAARG